MPKKHKNIIRCTKVSKLKRCICAFEDKNNKVITICQEISTITLRPLQSCNELPIGIKHPPWGRQTLKLNGCNTRWRNTSATRMKNWCNNQIVEWSECTRSKNSIARHHESRHRRTKEAAGETLGFATAWEEGQR